MDDGEEILWAGRRRDDHVPKARRRGNVVLRDAGPSTPVVLSLLRYLESVGFSGAPRVVGEGLSADGREILTFIPGESPQPGPWPTETVAGVGEILRAFHDAVAGFEAPPDAVWQPLFSRELPMPDPIIGHGDTGPWNWIAQNGRPVALVDWEYAGPVDRMTELTEAVWLNAQLHDDDVAELNGLSSADERARQARAILDGYGLTSRARRGFVWRMIEYAVHSARAEAVKAGVTQNTRIGVTNSGYRFVWAITWRARAASWMLTNRALLERVIER